MKAFIVIITVSLAWISGFGCGSSVDKKDPKAVALAALEAIKTKNLEGLGQLATYPGKEPKEMLVNGFKPRFIEDAQWSKAVQGWDGKLQADKTSKYRFYGKFGEADGKIAAVRLGSNDGYWLFNKLEWMTPEDWDKADKM